MSHPDSSPFDQGRFLGLQGAQWRPRSVFVAPLPEGAPVLTAYSLMERGRTMGIELEEVHSERAGHVELRFNDLHVFLHGGSLRVDPRESSTGQCIGPELAESLGAAEQFVTVEVMYDYPVLRRFHMVLQLICYLVPEAAAVHDSGRAVWMTREWIRTAAARRALPPPDQLFSIRTLEEDGWVWMHTHGLLRCGAIELEAQGYMNSAEAKAMGRLLHTAAVRLTEARDPDEREPFDLGPNIRVAWVRWDAAYPDRPLESLGAAGRREGCDGLVASLFRATGRGEDTVLHPITSLLPVLLDTPRWYATKSEMQRSSMLASKHWKDFRRVFRGRSKAPGWRFEVGLGFETDGPGDDIEQLWFVVHDIEGARVDATLLNAPLHLDHMEEGDRRWHAVDQLYQWRVDTPGQSFGPERAAELLRTAGL